VAAALPSLTQDNGTYRDPGHAVEEQLQALDTKPGEQKSKAPLNVFLVKQSIKALWFCQILFS